MKSLVRSFFAFILGAFANGDLRAVEAYQDVPADEFRILAEKGDGIILDVRTPDEVSQGHLPGASVLNFYDDDFERKLNLMRKDVPIYVYCRSGGRSAQVAKLMKANGFENVYNLLGGIGAWNKARFPTETPSGVAKKSGQAISQTEFEKLLGKRGVTLVDFHTPWCAPCKQMAPIVDDLEAALDDRASILRIDLDANPHLAEAYAVQGVPVFALFVKGKETWRHSGVIDAKALQAAVEDAL